MLTLTDPSTIRSLLNRYGFRFSKSLGQNFLINPSVCPRMAELCGAGKGTGVIEIGPGIGVLTAELAKRAGRVAAIELDERLLPVLTETLGGFDNVKVIRGDVLKTDLSALIREEFAGMDAVVCANLPYYITSPVIMHLLESKPGVKSITLMVQKEVAERICAAPGTRQSSAFTLTVRYYAEPSRLFGVSSGSFMPRPNVDSEVIRLDIRPAPPVAVPDEKRLFACIRAAFGQRRKTILNALSSGMGIPKETAASVLASAGISPAGRGEQLTLEDFARLSSRL